MKYLFVIFLAFTISSYAQNNRTVFGKKYAKEELDAVLAKKSGHNVVDNKELIVKSSNTAIKIAEAVLFEIYGKANIEEQKPYEKYLIKNYWVISGTLPERSKGGTFLIIIDAKNAQVLKITHGK
ncbi:NTF2 fold immunity protein [Flavobacterium fluvii]|uniref:NTF2 fold immunity protein n=1 Tax=Flavobacterium fluvii TaxID=468056 RepID=A0A1M5F9E1_9FLAO|nr:YbbC/YhhH family protein [Flavobacterium fluvii]SHF88137.1 NTF2 fold immunity protein [Flavobacterium fluvii]